VRLVAGEGDDLGPGEKAIEEGRGLSMILSTVAVELRKDEKYKKDVDRYEALAKKKREWTDKMQKDLDAARVKKDAKAIAKLEPNEPTAADAKEMTDLEPTMGPIWYAEDNADALDADKAKTKAEADVTKLEKNNAAKKQPQSDVDLKKHNAVVYAARDKARTEATDAAAQAKTREKYKKIALDKRLALLRDRAEYFGRDFLLECDARYVCPQRLSYILVELDKEGIEDLQKDFDKAPSEAWDGKLLLGG
jgi:hypothetical protein